MNNRLSQDHLHVTVDLLILTEKEGKLMLLLSRRPHAPCEGQWALPGRFVALEESAEETAALLMEEMLPVRCFYTEQLYTFTQPKRDPRGRILSIAYLVIVPWQQLQPVLGQEGVKMECFCVSCAEAGVTLTGADGKPLEEEELAFDHPSIIRTGIVRMQGKIDYTDIGFRFLNTPQAFSLSELQRVFEAVLGKAQDASNFRRFVKNRYEESGKIKASELTEKRGRGRPSVLYSWHG